jgi:predicted small lipoprotein YifL
MKSLTWILAATGALLLAACGQKGSLYLPEHSGSVVTRPGGATEPGPQETPQGTTQPQSPAPQAPTQSSQSQSSQSQSQPPK